MFSLARSRSRVLLTPPARSVVDLVCGAVLATLAASPVAAQDRQATLDAMKRATTFMIEKVSTEGGYVWAYLPDLSRRWGELEARPSQIWIQPPGTPTVGHLYLDAYHATGDEFYYRAAEGVARALVQGQHPSGGWNYVVDFAGEDSLRDWYATIGRNAWRLEEFQRYRGNATFDDAGTAHASKFLLRIYVEKRDPQWKPALDQAIRFVLESQFPGGGWPQRFPPGREPLPGADPDYASYITFNDGVANENIEFLMLCYQALGERRLLDPIARGMHAFVALQQPAPQAGWALQYTRDGAPAGARTYEPRAIVTHTTAANVLQMIRFYRLTGDPEFLARVPEAIEWLERVASPPGLAPPGRTHPTFLEVGTDTPLYVHRSGSNVTNGRYFVDREPQDTVAHYNSFRLIDVAELRRAYGDARALSPAEAAKDSPLVPGARPRPLPEYFVVGESGVGPAEEAARVVAGVNADGAWISPLRMTSHPYSGPSPAQVAPGSFSQSHVGDASDTSPFPDDALMGISTGAFVRNMSVLIRHLDTVSPASVRGPVTWRLDSLERIGGHAVTLVGTPRVVETDLGPAVEFNGRTDGLFLDVNPLQGLTAFTIEVVFQPAPDGGEEQRFFHVEEAGSGNRALVELRMRPGGQWALDTYLRSGTAASTLLDRDRVHAPGRWHVAALVYDGRTMSHFVDGVREQSGDVAFAPLGAGRTSIGVRQNRVSWFKGRIHRVVITPAALAPGQLQAAPGTSRPSVVVPAVSEPRLDPTRDPARRAVFVIGDATVKNHGPGEGWGDFLAAWFDGSRIQVLNWAMGGRSSRSFLEEGRWQKARAQMRPGDVVLVQFGHNDQRPLTTDRGTIPAVDDQVQQVVSETTKEPGAVRTYGWYLRQYVRDARAKGALIVLVSPVPRSEWSEDGRLNLVMAGHARLVQQVADEEGVPFLDLHASVAQLYESLGRDVVMAKYFTVGDSTHTNAAGAEASAACVVDGLRTLPAVGLASLLEPTARLGFTAQPERRWGRGIEGQRIADLGNGYYLNPIVSGDHPDPSILKDGDDCYMTFSSFDAYPGLVLWHSRDLVNWTPMGPTLFRNVGSVWAPDLVKHGSRYYIYFPGIGPNRSNYVIWADDIRGPWSDPIDLKNTRIDPGHAVGPDGRRYLFLSGGYMVPLSDDGLSISGPEQKVYPGWRYPSDWIVEGFAQEGPKILKRGDYYYQVLAQGGTAGPPTGHMIVAARSKALEGPWEDSPYNPIVRTTSADEPWWSKGHGTLVEGPDGRWWMVYHAYEKGYYNLGRQALLEPVEWLDDGWFRVAKYDPGRPIPKPVPASAGAHGFAFSGPFTPERMGVQWSFYKGSVADRDRYRFEDGALVLKANGTSPSDSSPLWFVTGDRAYELEVEIESAAEATAGLLLFYNSRMYLGLGFSATRFIQHNYGLDRPGAKPDHVGRTLHIRLRNDRHIVTIYYSVDGQRWERFDRGFEVSGYHHNVGYDFLSLRPALYAAGSGEVRFRNFRYRALE
jgi:PelA/Pel-15E family pectate lyase